MEREEMVEELIEKIDGIIAVIEEKYYDDESFVPVVELLEQTKEELEELCGDGCDDDVSDEYDEDY